MGLFRRLFKRKDEGSSGAAGSGKWLNKEYMSSRSPNGIQALERNEIVRSAFKHVPGEDIHRVVLQLDGEKIWPPADLPFELSEPQPMATSSSTTLPKSLIDLPSEVLCRITDYLDDVGFVCLRNIHPYTRAVLNIDTISIGALGKYVLRGMNGLHGLPNPAISFCARCAERAHYWNYPDDVPSTNLIQRWRKDNVLDPTGRVDIVVCRQDRHFCNVGTKPRKSRQNAAARVVVSSTSTSTDAAFSSDPWKHSLT